MLRNLLPQRKPTFPVGVSVLLTNNQGQLLVARRRNCKGAGLLSTPGGRVELNETLLACAQREFFEETGAMMVGEPEIIGWHEHFRFGEHYFMFYAHATGYQGEIRNLIPDKSEDWSWADLRELTPENCTEPLNILELIGREPDRDRTKPYKPR